MGRDFGLTEGGSQDWGAELEFPKGEPSKVKKSQTHSTHQSQDESKGASGISDLGNSARLTCSQEPSQMIALSPRLT